MEMSRECWNRLLRSGGAIFLYALNTDTALLNISFVLSGSRPKYRSFVSAVKERQREMGGGGSGSGVEWETETYRRMSHSLLLAGHTCKVQ